MKTPPLKRIDCPACGSPYHRNTLHLKECRHQGLMYECGCGYGVVLKKTRSSNTP